MVNMKKLLNDVWISSLMVPVGIWWLFLIAYLLIRIILK